MTVEELPVLDVPEPLFELGASKKLEFGFSFVLLFDSIPEVELSVAPCCLERLRAFPPLAVLVVFALAAGAEVLEGALRSDTSCIAPLVEEEVASEPAVLCVAAATAEARASEPRNPMAATPRAASTPMPVLIASRRSRL